MIGYLKYNGELPTHTLKLDWVPGMEVSLEKIFSMFGSRCTLTDKLDSKFVEWFTEVYSATLNRGFELFIEESLGSEVIEETLVEEDQVSNKVFIESSSVETSKTMQEAEDKLRKMRHPDTVGHIKREADSDLIKTNQTVEQAIKAMPKPGTMVMTGDDLVKSREPVITSKLTNRFMLNEVGSPVSAIPTSKEEAAKENAELANMSRRVQMLSPEIINDDGTTSQVIVGDAGEKTTNKKAVDPKEANTKKVNKNFKAYPMIGVKKDIRPEDIARNKDDKEAVRLLGMCKDITTLKVARIYANDMGKTRLVELIDRKIRGMHDF